MGEGREGDWECLECHNRNYAFRSLCNRCKQPRFLVDKKTPADSKWLPRIGDWICSGCSNNNYASREVCKKCGQSKEEAAMPAIAIPGAQLPTYAHYFARVQGLLGSKMNYGVTGNSALQQSLPPHYHWSFGGPDNYGLQPWPLAGSSSSAFSYPGITNQPPGVPEGWRSGDWICNCGYHNYSSRSEMYNPMYQYSLCQQYSYCKKCNAPLSSAISSSAARSTVPDFFPALGTKRLASEEFVNEWDNKRLNAGDTGGHFLYKTHEQHLYREQLKGSYYDQERGLHPKYSSGMLATAPPVQGNIQPARLTSVPPLLGKGAKQWRDGDWMCSNCNNHNYASRSSCNRCKTQKEATSQPASVA